MRRSIPRSLGVAACAAIIAFVAVGPPANADDNQPPIAAFAVTCTRLLCDFDATGSTDADGTVVSTAWDFGDGASASGELAQHRYANPGTFSVLVTVTDDLGATDTETLDVTATNDPPTAVVDLTCAHLVCTFDGSGSSDPDGAIAAYTWDAGDGSSPIDGALVEHTYAAAGTYDVRLDVVDDDGASATMTEAVTVVGNVAPIASFEVTCSALVCELDGSGSTDSDGTVEAWAWTVGGASIGTAPSISYTFPLPGEYPVRLTVSDDDGDTGAQVRVVDLTIPEPELGPRAADEFGRAVSQGWGQADVGGPWTPQSTWMVNNLRVANNVGLVTMPTANNRITARLNPIAEADTTTTASVWTDKPSTGGAQTAFVSARGTDSGDYRLRVRLVAGEVKLAAMRAPASGSYIAIGAEVTVAGLVHSANNRIRLRFEVSGAAPTRLRARAWPDGTSEPGTWAFERFDSTATLTAAGRPGFATSVPATTLNVPIAFRLDDFFVQRLDEPPAPTFSVACTALVCNFDASASSDDNGILEYGWNFGDGTVDVTTGAVVSHTYTDEDRFTVTLSTSDSAWTITARRTASTLPNQPPVAEFTHSCNAFTCTFDGSTSRDDDGTLTNYSWAFGDGAVANGPLVTHTFSLAGAYSVELGLTDDDGAPDTIARTVEVVPPTLGTDPVVTDSFTRTTTNGWGSANLGGVWEPTAAGQAGSLATNGTSGRITLASPGSKAGARLPALTALSTQTTATISTDKAASSGAQLVFASARAGVNGDYRLRVRFNSGVTTLAFRSTNASGAETPIGTEYKLTTFVHDVGRQLRLRFQAIGANPTVLRAKAWPINGIEPVDWNIVFTDNTPALQTAGRPGFVALLPTNVTNAPVVTTVDDLAIVPVDEVPEARIDVDCEARLCAFDASTSSDDNGTTRYDWNFGDGTTLGDAPATVSHLYPAAGSFHATLSATDTRGAIDAATVRDVPLAARPNYVVIMTDDQTIADMQVLDKTQALLGDNGANFVNAFSSYPLCCPSRATFLSGQYSHNHRVHVNTPPFGGFQALDHSNTVATWLDSVGYRTAVVGKVLNGYSDARRKDALPGWDDFQVLTNGSEYRFFDYTMTDNGTLVSYGSAPSDYQTDVIASRAADVITEASAADDPLYLWVSAVAPHEEWVVGAAQPPRPAPRHQGAFADTPLPMSPSFNEADVSDKPQHIRNFPVFGSSTVASLTALHRGRLGSLLAVDDLVETVVEALTTAGTLDDTYVIFTSDNGFFLGEHRLAANKVRPYEEATRVPFLVRGPGIAPGSTVTNLTVNTDVAATVVAGAHATPGRALDGETLDFVMDPVLGADRAVLFENFDAVQGFTYGDGIRVAGYSFIDWVRPSGTHEYELYDHAVDPYELDNVAASPAYASIRAALLTKLNILRTCAGPTCRVRYP